MVLSASAPARRTIMNEAVCITLGSVVVGGLIGGFLRRDNRFLAVLQTLAIAAVLTGVSAHLLPEAIETLGGGALLVFIGALALPAIATVILRHLRRGHVGSVHKLGVELAFWGFLAHQVAEGLALGSYTSAAHSGHTHHDIVLAVAAHTLPLTAVFISEAVLHRGIGSALRRTLAIAAATLAGFILAHLAQATLHARADAWVSAGVAGFLVHVIFHGHGKQPPRTTWQGALEVLAAALGIALPILATPDAPGTIRSAVAHALIELAIETAPMLLLGLVLGALLHAFGTTIPRRFLRRGRPLGQALRGVAVGAPLPLCACGVLPIAESLRRRGAPPALVMAFLIATPELGPEALTLTVRFLGGPFALVRLAAAISLAIVAALVLARVDRSDDRDASDLDTEDAHDHLTARGRLRGVLAAFDELLLHTAPWTLVGLLAAAFVTVVVPTGSLAPLSAGGWDLVVVGLVAMPAYVCAASATPLAAVLLLKGISPGAVLVGLMLGPATNIATVGVLQRNYGMRAVVITMAAIFAFSLGAGYLVNATGVPTHASEVLDAHHDHSWLATAALGILGLALLGQLWRWGLGPWFAVLEGQHGHDHDHDHSLSGATRKTAKLP